MFLNNNHLYLIILGAVLFCLEEGLSYWSSELTSMMFLCAVCSNFVLHLVYTLYRRGAGKYNTYLNIYI